MLLEPVWTLILSTFFYDEPLGPAKLAGAGLVLGALVLYQLPLLLRSRKFKASNG
ncbi:hypothetical protein D3C80_899250 [compost metagenome]